MVDLLIAPLSFPFMQHAVIVAVTAAAVCGLLSCWLVLMGWSLMGEAVAHSILPGVVLASLVGLPLAVGAFLFGLVAVLLIGAVGAAPGLKRDTSIGVVFTSLFAVGLVLLSVTPTQTHLQHILFGDVLGASRADVLTVSLLGLVTITVLMVRRRDLVLFAFDRTYAHTVGLSTRGLAALLLSLLALTTVTALQTLGVILVVAMLVIPGATALLLSRTFSRMLLLSSLSAVLSALIGLYASYWLDVASGATIVLTQAVQFTLAYLFAPRRGLIARLSEGRRRRRISSTEPTAATESTTAEVI
ncbi:metal ABC transporter permease [Nesterenkonia aerolata]|uniref:Metal ABC transporter permease n=1 Tax=Nesterenkonia aerolata TaxID=3074079 RepID=A0ABU2DUY1_9MICC|nr:metal ABC transporter permease [Nesterenkonia sp. LY-0111]MDR8020196.1 metal ABC transporter permease [Nesterenkonia sp. LY-0111]